MTPTESYNIWLLDNEGDLKDQWESMGTVEKFEEGPTFDDYCKSQYNSSPDEDD